MSELKSIRDLFEDEVKDLYSVEKQLTKAIPKMTKGSRSSELQNAFQSHLRETEEQLRRLEQIALMLSFAPSGKKCHGMEGIIKEGAEASAERGDSGLVDLGIIAAAGRVEHYEMAGYITAITLAQRMREEKAVSLLKQSLAEEQGAADKLRKIAASLIKQMPETLTTAATA